MYALWAVMPDSSSRVAHELIHANHSCYNPIATWQEFLLSWFTWFTMDTTKDSLLDFSYNGKASLCCSYEGQG